MRAPVRVPVATVREAGRCSSRYERADYESEGGPVAGDDAAGRLRACLFEQGRMTAVYDAADDAQAGVGFRLDRTTGDRLYVLSGDAAMPDLEALCQAGTTEREWLALTAGTAEGLPLRFFSGHGDLTGAAAPEVVLTRGTARLDLHIRVVGTASGRAAYARRCGSAHAAFR